MLRRASLPFILIALLAVGLVWAKPAWEKKPWTEWSKGTVKRLLLRSPWVESFPLPFLERPGIHPLSGGGVAAPTSEGGGLVGTVMWRSAKPIRLGFDRAAELGMEVTGSSQEILRLDPEFHEQIIIACSITCCVYSSTHPSTLNRLKMRAANSIPIDFANSGFETTTFLIVKDRERIPTADFRVVENSSQEVLIWFVFPRLDREGKLWLLPDDQKIRFVAALPNGFRFDVEFSLKKMPFNGELEL